MYLLTYKIISYQLGALTVKSYPFAYNVLIFASLMRLGWTWKALISVKQIWKEPTCERPTYPMHFFKARTSEVLCSAALILKMPNLVIRTLKEFRFKQCLRNLLP